MFALLALALRWALDPVAAHFARRGLSRLAGYRGDFQGLHLSLRALSVTISHFTLVARGDVPVIDAEAIEARLRWRDLCKLRLGGQGQIRRARITLRSDPRPAPVEGGPAATRADAVFAVPDFELLCRALIPFRLDRLELGDSEILILDPEAGDRPPIWLHEVTSTLENVSRRTRLRRGQSATVALTARLQRSGKVTLFVTADPGEHTPAFAGQVTLRGQRLSEFHAFTLASTNHPLGATLDFFGSFKAAHGEVRGGLRPVIRDQCLGPTEGVLEDPLEARPRKLVVEPPSGRRPPSDAVLTVIPLRAQLDEPDVQLWPSVLGVLRGAFVSGIRAGFADLGSRPAGVSRGGAPGLAASPEAVAPPTGNLPAGCGPPGCQTRTLQ